MTLAMEGPSMSETKPELIARHFGNQNSDQLMSTRLNTSAKPPQIYDATDLRVSPLIWEECAWEPEVTTKRAMPARDYDPTASGIVINGGNTMKHKKLSIRRQATMKALIIYDDVDSAARAVGILRRAASLVRVHSQWDIKPWRIGVLRLPIAAEEALREVVDADAIVFADLRGSRLPTWLKGWLKRWRVRRQPGEPALVVTCASPTTKFSGVSHELLRFAAQNNLDLILEANPSVVVNCLVRALVPPEGESLLPPASDQDLVSPAALNHNSYRNWGINE
jgi:hypothetical protein